MHQVFSIEESLKFAWQKLKTHSAVLFGGAVILFVLDIIAQMADKSLGDTGMGVAAGLLLLVASIVLNLGFFLLTLKIARGESPSLKEIIPPARLGFQIFLVSILVSLLVFAGLILLIIPGIYFMLRFGLANYAVAEGSPLMESFEKSTKLTEGHKWQLLGFLAVFIVINILGAIPFGLGLILTIPLTMVAYAHVYLKLKQAAHAHPTGEAHDHNHEGHDHHDHTGHDHSHTENA
ncbi:MAG: hypothetical protein V4436_03595 [Patescibacteria group bacterium]